VITDQYLRPIKKNPGFSSELFKNLDDMDEVFYLLIFLKPKLGLLVMAESLQIQFQD
jgi:hypothetical protein